MFPLDNLSIGVNGYCDTAGTTKCQASTITSASIINLIKGLRVVASDGEAIYATQSAIHNIAFTNESTVVAGKVRILIPAGGSSSATSQDGAPDGGPNAGFDLNGLTTAASHSLCPTGGGVSWTSATPTITAYQSSGGVYYHQFDCAYTGTLTSTALTMTIGDSTLAMVNPAPKVNATYTHAQGTADTYNVRMQLLDGSNNIIDSVITSVSPIEGVLVSANVNPSLTFVIGPVNGGTTVCGVQTSPTTTATSVPFGDITTTGSFLNAAHTVSVATNAPSGYTVKVAEDKELSADLNGDGVPDTTLIDTTCDSANCTHVNPARWNTTSTQGWGYSLAANTGSPTTPFVYSTVTGNCATGTFCARNFACVNGLNPTNPNACGTNDVSPQTIMSSTTVSSIDSIYVCYRLNVSAIQQAGYYQTRLYYIAAGTF